MVDVKAKAEKISNDKKSLDAALLCQHELEKEVSWLIDEMVYTS